MSDETIDTRVTPSLHPRNVHEIDGYDDETASILAATETAFSEAYKAVGRVHDARAAAADNPVLNEAAQLIETQNFADKILAQVTKRFDSADANLATIINSVEKELSAPIETTGAAGIASEIRAHVAALPTGKRITFIQAAITDGDKRTATAILGAPPYLSGIDGEMQKTMTRLYHEHHNPKLAKRLRAAQGARDLLGRNAPLLFGEMKKAVGDDPRKIARLRAAKSAAEKAFVVGDA